MQCAALMDEITAGTVKSGRTFSVDSLRRNPPQNMSVPELAIYLGISERKTRELIALRSFKVVRFGSRIVIRCKDVEKYLQAQAS